MNGLTQSTAAKILALNPISELEVLKILDAAFTEVSATHADESEDFKKIVNETSLKAIQDVKTANDALAAKQNEVIGLRDELTESRKNVASAANQIAELQSENSRIVEESKQAHSRNDELVAEHLELRREIEELTPKPEA